MYNVSTVHTFRRQTIHNNTSVNKKFILLIIIILYICLNFVQVIHDSVKNTSENMCMSAAKFDCFLHHKQVIWKNFECTTSYLHTTW